MAKSLLTVGDQFPAYTATAVVGGDLSDADAESPYDHFVTASSQDHAGQWRVIFFWPRDVMAESQRRIAAFGQLHDEFDSRGAKVLGASVDNKYAHFYWRTHLECLRLLPFPLLSDFSHVLAAAAGVLNVAGVAERATFIIDPDNEIRYVAVTSDTVGQDVGGVLRVLEALQSDDLRGAGGQGRHSSHRRRGGAYRSRSSNGQTMPRAVPA